MSSLSFCSNMPSIKNHVALAGVSQLVGVLSRKLKGCRLNIQSGHVQEAIDRCFSLSSMFLSLSPFPSLPFSLKLLSMSLGED